MQPMQITLSTQIDVDLAPARRGRFVRSLLRRPLTLAGAVIVLLFAMMAIFGPLLAPHDPTAIFYVPGVNPPSPPSATFPFGLDDAGRDMLSRVLAGARISLVVGVVAVGIATFFGTLLGLISGYFGGWTDQIIMRLMDLMLAFPD